ncbi:DnaJ subfamily B member 1 [Araneus ventricosus]|uniref:DnaJ subfamily B member 1 n=1 Tax=Araneus ventricosus TaxID=182803 RepID=A0A4Y2N9K6_ARAVE|nr:DnaJ subfamily B member 1 [Araneus ventricosus]
MFSHCHSWWQRVGDPKRNEANYSVMMQMLPILFLVILSILTSFFIADPTYSLSKSLKYPYEKRTSNLRVPYYVKENFASDFQGSVQRLEAQVEEEYIANLRGSCFKERNYRESMIWRAKNFRDRLLEERAKALKTPSCDALNELYNSEKVCITHFPKLLYSLMDLLFLPQFQLHEILWVAASSTVGHRVERHHLQSVCLQDVVLVDQTDKNRLGLSLGCKVDAVALTNQTFHLFGPLKHHLADKHFADDNYVPHEVLLWMRQQPKEFYAAGIGLLIKRWDKFINIGGDYVEK